LSDVFLPAPEEVLAAPAADIDLEGTIVGFSDSGPTPDFFAVIDVVRKQAVVVAVGKLDLVRGTENKE